MTEGKRLPGQDRSVWSTPRIVVVSRAEPGSFERAIHELGRMLHDLAAAVVELATAAAPESAHFVTRVRSSLFRIETMHAGLARLAECANAQPPGELAATVRTAVVLAEGALACHGVWLAKVSIPDDLDTDPAPDCTLIALATWMLSARERLPGGGTLAVKVDASPVSLSLTLADSGGQRHMATELAALPAAAFPADRDLVVDHVSRGLAHQLNNPLFGLTGFSELVKPAPDANVQPAVARIAELAAAIATLARTQARGASK